MSFSALGSLLESTPPFVRLLKAVSSKRAGLRVQVTSDAAPFALSTLWRQLRLPMLVVAPRPEDARRLHEQLAIWER